MGDHMYEEYGYPAVERGDGDAEPIDFAVYGPPPAWQRSSPDERIGRLPRFAGLGPEGYRRADDRIREDVCERMTTDDHLDAHAIEVAVEDGVVLLDGEVPDRESRWRADEIAAWVSGVHNVHNRLRVRSPS